jgi:hypothetical protein
MKCGTLLIGLCAAVAVPTVAHSQPAPAPVVQADHPVQWWAAFKFNAKTSPTALADPRRKCPFGGDVQPYQRGFSQAFAYASSEHPQLVQGTSLLGPGDGDDPVGATFDQIYNGDFSYVVWNDQFYRDPQITGCSGDDCGPPWAHSKGILAWDDAGHGLVLQVTTPSWPASGSTTHPRPTDGNTLGCVKDPNLKVSQHFFALQLSPADTAKVLSALHNEGATTRADPQVLRVKPTSPQNLSTIANTLGDKRPDNAALQIYHLDSGATLISKPATLEAPPWQVVSAALGGEPLRVASWLFGKGGLPSTAAVKPLCWASDLGIPGRVEAALTGTWGGEIGLMGGSFPSGNHAKIAVSLPAGHHLTIFGDMNDDGRLLTDCKKEQNGRGGMFFVVSDPELWSSISALLAGKTAADGDRTVAEGATPWKPVTRKRKKRTHH